MRPFIGESWLLKCFFAVLFVLTSRGTALTTTLNPRLAPPTETAAQAELTSTLSAQVTVLDNLPPAAVARTKQSPRSGRELVSEISVTAKPISVGRSAGMDDRLEDQSLAALFPQIYSRLVSNSQKNSAAQVKNSPDRLWSLLGQSLLERRREHTKPSIVPVSTSPTMTTTTTSTTSTTRKPTTARPSRIEKKAEKPKDISASLLPQLLEELRDNAEIKDINVRQLHRRVLFDMLRMALESNSSSTLGSLHRTVVMSEPEKAPASIPTSSTTTSTTTSSTTTELPLAVSSEEFFGEIHRENFVDVEHVGPNRVCFFYKGLAAHRANTDRDQYNDLESKPQKLLLSETDPTLVQFSQQVQVSWDEFIEKVRQVAKGSWEYMAKQMTRGIHTMI